MLVTDVGSDVEMVVFLPAAGESRRDYLKTARTVFLSREYSNVDPADRAKY